MWPTAEYDRGVLVCSQQHASLVGKELSGRKPQPCCCTAELQAQRINPALPVVDVQRQSRNTLGPYTRGLMLPLPLLLPVQVLQLEG